MWRKIWELIKWPLASLIYILICLALMYGYLITEHWLWLALLWGLVAVALFFFIKQTKAYHGIKDTLLLLAVLGVAMAISVGGMMGFIERWVIKTILIIDLLALLGVATWDCLWKRSKSKKKKGVK